MFRGGRVSKVTRFVRNATRCGDQRDHSPFFMNDEFTLVDCYMTAILYRLPYLGVSVPNSKSFSSLKSYQEKLFKRPSFELSLTDSERDLKYSF